jgi:lysophospholipase L1-like esterase
MTHTLRRIPSATLSVLAAVAVVTATAAPAASATQSANKHDKKVQYVALGDSYSAGVGTDAPTNVPCYRSPLGFAPMIAEKNGWTLDYQACSGLTAAQILSDQVPAMSKTTDVVTVTAGGNDIHFGDVIGACVVGNDAQCAGMIGQATQAVVGTLPQALDQLYRGIKAGAPKAKIVVAGYPRLFGADDCATQPKVNAAERIALNAVADAVDTVIAARARAAHLTYVDVRDAFVGHATCAAKPYINTLVGTPAAYPGWDSFHPNRDGNAVYARLVSAALPDRDRCHD